MKLFSRSIIIVLVFAIVGLGVLNAQVPSVKAPKVSDVKVDPKVKAVEKDANATKDAATKTTDKTKKDAKEVKETKATKVDKAVKEVKEAKDAKVEKVTKEATDTKAAKEAKVTTEMKEAKAAKTSLLDINTISVDQLKSLPGIGDALAKKIVDGRPYKTKLDLVKKNIIPEGTYKKIADMIIAKQAAK